MSAIEQKVSEAPQIPLGKSAKSLPELVADQLLASILDGRYPPGTRLKEIALSQEHAVSRASIREALAILQKQRFVTRVPRFGARVSAVGNEEVYEIFEIREALLGIAARRAAQFAPQQTLAAFDAKVKQIEALAARESADPQLYAQHSIGAQQALIAASASRWLADLYEQLSGLSIWRVVIREKAVSFSTRRRRVESARDWRRVADALLQRNPEKAEREARNLLADSARFVRAQLEREHKGSAAKRRKAARGSRV